MLPLGELRPTPDVGPGPRKTRLTLEEQRTMLTLWSIARSPLILGLNLTMLDAETLKLITNEDLLRIDQTATASRQAWRTGDLIAWTADLPQGNHALAVFNLGDVSSRVTEKLTTFGLAAGAWHTHALWSSRNEAAMTAVDSTIPPHGCLLLLLNRQ